MKYRGAIFCLTMMLSACDAYDASNHAFNENENSFVYADNNEFDPDSLLPEEASPSVRAIMRTWYDQNELCRGSYDKKTIEYMCSKRDSTQDTLQNMGWCWNYENVEVFPTEYRWHPCNQKEPLNHKKEEKNSKIPDDIVHYSDDLSELKYNPPSERLAAYFSVAEDIDQKIGNANAIRKCGIRSSDWYQRTVRRLELYRSGPVVGKIFAHLKDDEKSVAYHFDKLVSDGQMSFVAGNFSKDECAMLAKSPFVYLDSAFVP